MLGFGLWWLGRAEAAARRAGEGYGAPALTGRRRIRPRTSSCAAATTAREFDPRRGRARSPSDEGPPIVLAALPLVVVVCVNFLMAMVVLPSLDAAFLAEERWGGVPLAAVSGVWAVATALAAATVTLVALNRRRLPALRLSMDAGANASVLPVLSVASLVGFGAVVAALPAFAAVREWVLSIGGGPLLVS